MAVAMVSPREGVFRSEGKGFVLLRLLSWSKEKVASLFFLSLVFS